MTKAAALREAQAWLRGYEVDGERVFDGVWYWGGVVVVGEG
jgi:CHAT domain-containing protein